MDALGAFTKADNIEHPSKAIRWPIFGVFPFRAKWATTEFPHDETPQRNAVQGVSMDTMGAPGKAD